MSIRKGTTYKKNSDTMAGSLQPGLPFDMASAIARGRSDSRVLDFVKNTTEVKYQIRIKACADAFGVDYDNVRKLAGRIKQRTLDNLDVYLNQFIDNAEAAGIVVHYALDGDEVNDICGDIAEINDCKLCVKSKSMVTEETRLVPALERGYGVEVIETDLGEFVIQLDNDKPAHIVAPMIHKDRTAAGRAFARELPGVEYTDDVQELAGIARRYMRDKFCKADMGITGANFLVAGTGSIVICTNEGNADLVTIGPRVLVVVAGIEKVTAGMEEMAVYLKLLARSGTGQPLTVYTSFINRPRLAGNFHGVKQQVHIILVDNKRTELLRRGSPLVDSGSRSADDNSDSRTLLRCIRCGACLNACPVFRKAGGGHAYGSVYSGPIGAAITPVLGGLENYCDLPKASSLCGACYEVCPVDINIPRQLILLRRRSVKQGTAGKLSEKLFYKAWGLCTRHIWLYRLGSGCLRIMSGIICDKPDSQSGDSKKMWISKNQPVSKMIIPGWLESRDLQVPAKISFRKWWKKTRGSSSRRDCGREER